MEEKEKLEAIRVEYDRAIKAQSERDHVWGVLVLMINGTDHSAESLSSTGATESLSSTGATELVDDAMLNYWSFDKFREEIGY